MKLARQAEILKIIKEHDIDKQEDLVTLLAEKGFDTTQATISRDFRELKLTKVAAENGRVKYAVLDNDSPESDRRFISVLNEALISMTDAGNILVIKTASGMAMAAAAVLDEIKDLEIEGSIAGDNTIFCAAKSHEAVMNTMSRLNEMLGTKQ